MPPCTAAAAAGAGAARSAVSDCHAAATTRPRRAALVVGLATSALDYTPEIECAFLCQRATALFPRGK